MTDIESKLRRIYDFLEEHHSWNQAFQDYEYRRLLGYVTDATDESKKERLRVLLNSVLNTQSQPKIEPQAKFWRSMDKAELSCKSLTEFTKFLECEYKATAKSKKFEECVVSGVWHRFYAALCLQPSWGEKTSALFVKAAINVHRRFPQYAFWDDAPLELCERDRVHLPVDKVIIELFKRLDVRLNGFEAINRCLLDVCKFKPNEMLLWDDLWYWGFFNQRTVRPSKIDGSVEGQREFGWNEDKFWSQFSSQKGKTNEVKVLSEKFLKIWGVTAG